MINGHTSPFATPKKVMPTRIERMLCAIGFHRWEYHQLGCIQIRNCRRCPKAQRMDNVGVWRERP